MSEYTVQDIERVANFLKNGRDYGTPYVILSGAGCSKSAGMPLASELLDEIKSTERYAPHIENLEPAKLNDYGAVMSRLDRSDRKELLLEYLENTKVNWGHIAIAAMMGSGFISRNLTFNFDNVLAKACGICGIYPATYDFVSGATDTFSHIVTPSIIHLHGQGFGLSMLNSEKETSEHATKLRPLIRDTLTNNSVLVIGYSGLSDAIFPVILEEYCSEKRLFWIGFSKDCPPNVQKLVDQNVDLVQYLGGADSDKFLVDLARKLNCWPKIFSNPIDHIREEVALIASFPIGSNMTASMDLMATLKEHLDVMQNTELATSKNLAAANNFLTGNYEAIDVDDETLSPTLRHGTLFELGKKAYRGGMISEDRSLFVAAANFNEKAVSLDSSFVEATNNWGMSLYQIAEIDQTLETWELAIDKMREATAEKPDYGIGYENLGNALLGKALLSKSSKDFEMAKQVLEKAVAINPGSAYGLACWYAIHSSSADCKEQLEKCLKAGTLPDCKHLKHDPDLVNVKGEKWFVDLCDNL